MNKLTIIVSIVLVVCVFEINAQYGWNNNQNQGQGNFPGFPNNNFPTPFPINPQNVNTRFVEETAIDNNGQKSHTRRVCDNNGCREEYSGAKSYGCSTLLLISAYVASRFM